MTVAGDRQSASLLSALAEAPDSAAASSFLVAQLAELSGAQRVAMLRLDAGQETLSATAASVDKDVGLSIALSDFANPLVLSALSLSPVVGDTPLPVPFSGYRRWTALPMTQPRTRLAPPVLPFQQSVELLSKLNLAPLKRSERVGTAPGGVI